MAKPGSRRLLTLSAVAAALIGAAAPAGAGPGTTPTPSTTVMGGMTDSGAMLTGYFTATNFAIDPGGQLVVDGMLNGHLSAAGRLQTGVSQPIILPVDRQNSSTTCRMLDLALGPGKTSVGGDPLHLKQTELIIMQWQGPGSRLLMPFCDAARRLRGPVLDPAVLIPLNEAVRLVAGRPN